MTSTFLEGRKPSALRIHTRFEDERASLYGGLRLTSHLCEKEEKGTGGEERR
jgi:hypothetical protein